MDPHLAQQLNSAADPNQGYSEAALNLVNSYQQQLSQQQQQQQQQPSQQQQQLQQQLQQQQLQQQYLPNAYQQYAQLQQQYQQQMQQYSQSGQNPLQQYQQYAQQASSVQQGVSSPNGLLQPGRPKGALGKKGKKKDPNRPKRPTSAYFFFIASKREEARMRGEHISKVAQWTKDVSAMWRALDAETKEQYDKLAVADKKRFEAEMQAYSGKRPKDANRPKRPQSAYFLFLADFREKNKSRFTGEGSHKELIRAAGEAWNKLTPVDKAPFERLAEIEKQKYEEAMKVYNAGGFAKKPKTEEAEHSPHQQQQEASSHQEHHLLHGGTLQDTPHNNGASAAPPEDYEDEEDEDDDGDE